MTNLAKTDIEDFVIITINLKINHNMLNLPCKVGDKVYKVIGSKHFGNHIQEMTVEKFGMFAHTNFEMIFGMKNNWDVFFDKSKAEAKLKELNKK